MTLPATLVAETAVRNSDPTAMLRGAGRSGTAKAKSAAQDFEAVFLGQMFQHMFTGIDGEGPFGGGVGVGIWRSFLTDQYAKSFAKAGGVGLAHQVYRSLLAHQEASATPAAH